MNFDETTSFCAEEESLASIDLEEKDKHPEIFLTLKESFLKAFKVMDKELRMHPSIDCFCSGTTAVTMIKQGQDLIIGNVGDSRAIIGTRDEHDALIAVQLTLFISISLIYLLDGVNQNEDDFFDMFDNTTPIKASEDLPYSASSDNRRNMIKQVEEYSEPFTQIKRRRMLQFDTHVNDPCFSDEHTQSAFVKSKVSFIPLYSVGQGGPFCSYDSW